MIYELAVITKADAGDGAFNALSSMVKEVIAEFKGELLIEDVWGQKVFAQASESGHKKGHYTYFMFKGGSTINAELSRKLGINEHVIRHLIINLGEDRFQDKIVKLYKTPLSKKYYGSVADAEVKEGDEMEDREHSKFSRRRGCWFTSKEIRADWKDPKTFMWLINEFVKISPARISGISRKHQRFSTTAIKRARAMGIASYLSNRAVE